MADCSAILTRLNFARAALDTAMAGGAIRAVTDSDGSRIEYTAASPARLLTYISRLQAEYDMCIGAPITAATKPLTFLF